MLTTSGVVPGKQYNWNGINRTKL